MIKTILLTYSISMTLTTHATTLKGMHDTIGGSQSNGFENITKLSGKSPEVLSSDFGYSTHPNDDYRKRKELLTKFKEMGPKVKILTLSYHQCRPDIKEPCTFNTGVAAVDFSPKEWAELLTWDSPLNKLWQKQMSVLAEFLNELQKINITIYFRPYHESNIANFWWGDTKKPQHSAELWRMLHTFFTKTHKLTNLKWVWSISYHPKHLNDLKAFYPGDNYVDVLGVDIYPPKKNSPPEFAAAWNLLNAISPTKPKALTEVSQLPSSAELEKRAWQYVVPWGETMLRKENTTENIKEFYK